MPYSQNPLSQETLYQKGIAITVVDPTERARFASQPLEFRAINGAVVPKHEERRNAFLADLSAFIRTGDPGNFTVVEESLRELYLVAIGGVHRISRKVYATHPSIPGKLLVIGGVGIVRPDEHNHCLTLQTPAPDVTLHQLLPDLEKTSMSAAHPTSSKTIESIPNEDPVGGYSLRVAEFKYCNVAMISEGKKGIDPLQFPVIENVAWGTMGQGLAFYVYAVPANAMPVCEMLHANDRAELTAALGHYLRAGRKLMRALRHLHEAGYVFNQPHQGNVYYYQDEKGEDRIAIADLDTLQSIRDYSPKIPAGSYLSPKAFATLVNAQVACTHIAHIAWIDFFRSRLRELGIDEFPGVDKIYASIVCDLIAGYLNSAEDMGKSGIFASISDYFNDLYRQGRNENDATKGISRLVQGDLYEIDVFGFMFTYMLLNAEYCKKFGARLLTEGIKQSDIQQKVKVELDKTQHKMNGQIMARMMSQMINQIIEQRSNEAMQEYIQALSRRKRISKIAPA